MTGLVCGLRIARAGHACDVYERWPGLGGQVATLDVGDGRLLERYYHHLFTSDEHIVALYAELGMADAVEWLPSSVAMYADGRSHPFTTPLDLLRFRPLSIRSRIRMGLAVLALQRRHPRVEPFERMTAHAWIVAAMGDEAWLKVWGPLLRGKFGDRAEDISMAWLWSKLTLRRRIKGSEARQELLGYPRGGWQPLLERLREGIERGGGRVLIDEPVAAVQAAGDGFDLTAGAPQSFRRGHDPGDFEHAGTERYDAVIATVPSNVFRALLSDDLTAALEPDYLDRLGAIEYHTALCVLLELDRSFSPFYWTNIASSDLPFVGLIEQTNLIDPVHYGGRRFLYVANYLARGDPLLDLDGDELLDLYEPGLRKVNSAFNRTWVRRQWTFTEPAAQPIVTPGYRDRMPAIRTGVRNLFLANTTQIYPEDRGTNYSVRLADEATAALLSGD